MEKVRGKGSTGTRGFLPGRTIGGLSEAGKGWQENGAAFVLCYNCFRHRTLKGAKRSTTTLFAYNGNPRTTSNERTIINVLEPI